MSEEFYRIKRLPPYVFSEVNALKARARAAGRDVIDLGIGEVGQHDDVVPAAERNDLAIEIEIDSLSSRVGREVEDDRERRRNAVLDGFFELRE